MEKDVGYHAVLDFRFLMDDLDGDPREEGRKFVARFERFVHGVLDNRESTNLDIVHYLCKIQRCEAFVSMQWLDCVALLMPLVIHIYIHRFNIDVCNEHDLVFSCASLHYLSMEFCIAERPIIDPMSIYLPCLEFLRLTGVEIRDDFAQKLFIGDATIKLQYDDDDDDDDYVPVLNLFAGLSNVTNLELHLNIPKLKGQMEKHIFNCRNFNNLKKLCIGIWNMSCDSYLIACFLKHSPNLKDLTFKLFVNPGDNKSPDKRFHSSMSILRLLKSNVGVILNTLVS